MCKSAGFEGIMHSTMIQTKDPICTRDNFTNPFYIRLQSVNAVGRNESVFVARPCIAG